MKTDWKISYFRPDRQGVYPSKDSVGLYYMTAEGDSGVSRVRRREKEAPCTGFA